VRVSEDLRNNEAASRKARLRKQAALARQQAYGTDAPAASQRILESGLQLIASLGSYVPLVAAGYYPIRDEIDPLRLLDALQLRGSEIVLPIALPGPALSFRRWTFGTPLVRSKLGLSEPKEETPTLSPDFVLVPLLAFNRKGHRLGYGGGYYDAALKGLRQKNVIVAVGVGFDEQEFDDIPQESQDETLDFVLTPSGFIRCGD
jgi:5-formyltetrahydrofolate cyclo-ligase